MNLKNTIFISAVMGALIASAPVIKTKLKKYAVFCSVFGVGISNLYAESLPGIAVDTYAMEDQSIYDKYKNEPKSIQLLELRSANGDLDATYDLFVFNFRGYMMNINIPRAKKLLDACNSQKCKERKSKMNGNIFSGIQTEVVDPWRSDFVSLDKNKDGLSDDVLREAEQGNRHAQYLLGKQYYEGNTLLKRNVNSAVNWFYRSAQRGLVDAQLKMGELYENGDGVPVSLNKALHWYREVVLNKSIDESDARFITASERIKFINGVNNKKALDFNSKLKSDELIIGGLVNEKHKHNLMSKLMLYTVNGYFESGYSLSEKAVKSIIKNSTMFNDLGWFFYKTNKKSVFVAVREIREINPFHHSIKIQLLINTEKESTSVANKETDKILKNYNK